MPAAARADGVGIHPLSRPRRLIPGRRETAPSWETGRTAERQRTEVRRRVGATYDQAEAFRIAEGSIRKEARAKNRPADLINIALEKVVGAGLELPAFSTLDAMASTCRKEVNSSNCMGIPDRVSAVERAGLLRLLEERDPDGTTQYTRLNKSTQSPTWSHFKRLRPSGDLPFRKCLRIWSTTRCCA
ncbi:DUF4158 domain-containing protein [Streptomyces cellulosae]|nr:DUF4158 domain-containing protein [Streptomyces cellulosae]